MGKKNKKTESKVAKPDTKSGGVDTQSNIKPSSVQDPTKLDRGESLLATYTAIVRYISIINWNLLSDVGKSKIIENDSIDLIGYYKNLLTKEVVKKEERDSVLQHLNNSFNLITNMDRVEKLSMEREVRYILEIDDYVSFIDYQATNAKLNGVNQNIVESIDMIMACLKVYGDNYLNTKVVNVHSYNFPEDMRDYYSSIDVVSRLERLAIRLSTFSEYNAFSYIGDKAKISYTIPFGCLCIFGKSESGKTTLASMFKYCFNNKTNIYKFHEPDVAADILESRLRRAVYKFLTSDQEILIIDSIRYKIYNTESNTTILSGGVSSGIFTYISELSVLAKTFSKTIIVVVNVFTKDERIEDEVANGIIGASDGYLMTKPGLLGGINVSVKFRNLRNLESVSIDIAKDAVASFYNKIQNTNDVEEINMVNPIKEGKSTSNYTIASREVKSEFTITGRAHDEDGVMAGTNRIQDEFFSGFSTMPMSTGSSFEDKVILTRFEKGKTNISYPVNDKEIRSITVLDSEVDSKLKSLKELYNSNIKKGDDEDED